MTSHLASLWNRGLDNSQTAYSPIYAQRSEDWVGFVSKCIMGLIERRYHFFGSVHTYLEIFDNTDFLLRFWKNTRPHGAYSNRLRSSTRKRSRNGNVQGTQTTSYSKIRFSPFTRKRQAHVFKKLHSGNRFRKPAFLVLENALYAWTERLNGYVRTGPWINPLSPESDQHEISPCKINAL